MPSVGATCPLPALVPVVVDRARDLGRSRLYRLGRPVQPRRATALEPHRGATDPHCDGLRPHRVRMWLHSPDPEFARKVREVCALYRTPPEGARVLCIDEKPGMQALERVHPTSYSRAGCAVRYEFEYLRHGTHTLIAAFDVGTGEVFGQCRRRTAKGLMAFMETLAKRYPTGVIYIVWDNLNIHHGPRAVGRVQRASRLAVPLRPHAAPCLVGQPGGDLVQHPPATGPQVRLLPVTR